MYLVIGFTGNVGGKVVNQLLEGGHEVRAFVRNAAHAANLPTGFNIAVGELNDGESLLAATRGVEGILFMQAEPLPTRRYPAAGASSR